MSGAPYNKDQYTPLDTFAYEALAVTTASTPFTAATYDSGTNRAICAVVRVETAPIRVRLDGTAPTATVGTLFQIGDAFIVWGTMDIDSFRAISQNGNTATLDVSYSK